MVKGVSPNSNPQPFIEAVDQITRLPFLHAIITKKYQL